MKKNEKITEEVNNEIKAEEVKEEQCSCGSECKCKKSNGTLIIVVILLMFVCLVGGLIGGYMLRFDDKDERCATNEEIKNDENESSSGISNAYLDEIYSAFDKVDVSQIDYYDLISSSDSMLSFDFVGAMYGNVTENFKMFSTLGFVVYKSNVDFYEIGNKYSIEIDDESGFYIRKSDLAKLASKFYANVDLSKVYIEGKKYESFTVEKCDGDVCMVTLHGVGGTGPMSEYRTKVLDEKNTNDGTIITVESFYIDVIIDSGYSYELKINHFNPTVGYLRENIGGNEETFPLFGQSYDEMVKNLPGGKGITYEFNFNKEGKFVSVSKK